MNDELMIVNNLDQPIPLDGEEWLYQQVDAIMDKASEEKNIEIAINGCVQLINLAKLSGLALARMLYRLHKDWVINHEVADMLFERSGLRSETIDAYVDVWHIHEKNLIPEQHRKLIRQRNIKDQIPIAKLISQGHDVTEADWNEIAHAPDYTTVAAKIREIKGTPPRKGSLQLHLKRNGDLYGMMDGRQQFVGYLNLEEQADPIVNKAIKRIESVGILRNW